MRDFLKKVYEFARKHYRRFRSVLSFLKYTMLPLGKRIWIIGTPCHGNLGDSAIILAEKFLMKKCGIPECRIKDVSFDSYGVYEKWLKLAVRKGDIITSPGGGNMGDIWHWEEDFRQNLIKIFPRNRFILFPHTIYYSPTKDGKEKENESRAVYDHSKNTLIARETVSFRKFHDLYPFANIILTPDIVLSTHPEDYGISPQERSGVLFCFRSDVEVQLTEDVRKILKKTVEDSGKQMKFTDTYIKKWVHNGNRLQLVREKLLEFSRAELVITDRLHGMIFSAITATPCLIFGNNNHKVFESYKWIKNLPYIRFCSDVDQSVKSISELLNMRDCEFDNTELQSHFQKIRELLQGEFL